MDQFSRFCTAYGTKCVYFTMGAPMHQKCPFPRGIWTSHVTHDALGPCEPTTETAPGSVQPRLHSWLQSVPIWFACFALKIVPSHVGIWTPCNTWFIGPTRVGNANGNLIVSALLQDSLVWQNDRWLIINYLFNYYDYSINYYTRKFRLSLAIMRCQGQWCRSANELEVSKIIRIWMRCGY